MQMIRDTLKKVGEWLVNTYDVAAAILCGLFWMFFITGSGLVMSPDSGYFLNAALRFHHGDYFLDPVRSPLYPFLINVFMWFTGSPGDAAALLSGVVFLLLMAVFSLILREFSGIKLLNTLIIVALFSYYPFMYVFLHAWTEGLFALLSLATVYFLHRHFKYAGMGYYILGAVCVSLAALTRYMGYALILCFFIYTLYFLKYRSRREKVPILRYLALNTITFVPVLIYVIRNYFTNGTFHGKRVPVQLTVFKNIQYTFQVLEKDLSVYLIALMVIALAGFIFILRTRGDHPRPRNLALVPLSFILVFVGLYIGMIWYTTSRVYVDPIATRYFSGIYPLLFLFGFWVLFLLGGRILAVVEGEVLRFPMLLGFFLLYGFAMVLIMVQGKPFAKALDKAYALQYSDTCTAVEAGYDLSTIGPRIGHYLKESLKETDRLYVSAIHEWPNRNHTTYLANLFLLRGDLTAVEGMNDLTVTHVEPETKDALSGGFVMSLNVDSVPKEIHYKHLPTRRAGKGLLVALNNIMKEAGTETFVLVVNTDHQRIRIGADLKNFLPPEISIQGKTKIGGYVLFKLKRLPAA